MPATQDKFTLIAERRTLLTQLRQDLADKEATVAFVGAGDVDLEARAFAREEADLESFTRGRLSAATVLRRHEPLARHVTLGLGGSAAWYAEPADRHDTSELLTAARALGLPVFVLGRGSNLLVPDDGYAGLVLHPTGAFWTGIEALGNNHFRVGGGVRLKELCGHAARLGISGFEFLEGIPGTIGGSLRMNAGAMGSWIFDRVVSLTWLDAHGIQHEALRTEIEAGYRDCPRLHDTVVMSAVLAGEGAPGSAAVRATMENFAQRRRASQPRDPSAGCVFRNPETAKAGALIDAAGLKDSVVGAARVSPVHANFIVNTGEATAADVITLMRRVRTQVRDQAGVTLEPEILLLGKTWEEVL
jgi:UDP-N-acetylenolpyruvoylglucosamine reductase